MTIVVTSQGGSGAPDPSTLLQLVQTALQGLGVMNYGQPSSVIGNSNQIITQTLALMNIEIGAMAREFQWQALTNEYRWTTVYYSYTGDLTAGSTTISNLSSTTGLVAGSLFGIVGAGVNQDTYLTAFNASASTGTMSQAASASGTAVPLTFCQMKYTLPNDFDRLVNRTDWDKSKHWEMLGPETAQQWQWLKSGYISTGPRIRFRPFGNYFQIWPALGSNEYLGFEYCSRYCVLATGDAAPTKAAFTLDTDTCVFSDPLMHALIRLSYYEAKGFDTTALKAKFDAQKAIEKANDAGAPVLSFAPRISNVLVGWENIPDAGYGA